MMEQERINIPLSSAAVMVFRYAGRKISEQIRATAFIIIYLFVFQTIILGTPAGITLRIAAGIISVIFGLTLFMEGLLHGLMPLGESVGLNLPRRSRLWQLIVFGLLVGFVSTLAEPAISALRATGSDLAAWEAPLLYLFLERHPGSLVAAVGGGVGLAVAASLLRYHFDLSLKPFIIVSVSAVLLLSLVLSFNESLKSIIGLAWDTGAVTTGPVTVPLVLALGIGVARSSGRQGGASEGFGTVALASLLPIFCVMVLSLGMYMRSPQPSSEADFFSQENRSSTLDLFSSEEELESYAFTHGSELGRRSFYGDDQQYRQALTSLAHSTSLLREMHLDYWLLHRASPYEQEVVGKVSASGDRQMTQEPFFQVIQEETGMSLRAVLPLSGLLLLILVVFLRDRPKYRDEFMLGMFLTLTGMILLTTGIRIGLVPLGDSVGRQLPVVYQAEAMEEEFRIENFDISLVGEGIGLDGRRYQFFYIQDGDSLIQVRFNPDAYDEDTATYTYVRTTPPLFGSGLTLLGMLFVLIFAFGLGYGSTLAEPALNALGRNVEVITVGTVKGRGVIRAVSVGVGIGLIAGMIRIIYAVPMIWLLAPAYLLLIPLTIWSDSDFAGISWDSGGVTTGPITVPLVMAMGLGIGGALDSIDGFGMLAMASVFPILSVQVYGFIIRLRQRYAIRVMEQEAIDE